MIANFISNFYPSFSLGRKEALFGDEKSAGDSVVNTILVLARGFIWKHKFTSKELDEVNFINFTRDQLFTICNCQKLKGKMSEFWLEWQAILDHFQVNIWTPLE